MTDSHAGYGSDSTTPDGTTPDGTTPDGTFIHPTEDDLEPRSADPVAIDCDSCDVRGLACGDCVVTVLLGAPPAWLDEEEQRAIGVLAESGLIPPLRLVASEGAAVHHRDEVSAEGARGAAIDHVAQKLSPTPWRTAPEVRGTG